MLVVVFVAATTEVGGEELRIIIKIERTREQYFMDLVMLVVMTTQRESLIIDRQLYQSAGTLHGHPRAKKRF